MRQIKCIKVYK